MADPRFFTRQGPYTLGEILAWSGGELENAHEVDLGTPIVDVAPIEEPRPGCLSFIEGRQFAHRLVDCIAAAVLVPASLPVEAPSSAILIRCKHPKFAFATVAARFYPPETRTGIHSLAVIDDSARIGTGVWIGPHVTIEAGAEIGDGAQIGASTTIGRGVRIGAESRISSNCSIHYALIGQRVRIEAGTRIGESGFGWAMARGGHRWIPQLGRVLIGDDVYVGANCTIDRGAGPDTVIGNGVLIDNLVQIGHNVTIGEGTILAGTVGIAGSARIGSYALIGAGVGVADHISIADGAQVVARSGVMNDVNVGEKWAGSPAMRAREFWRLQAVLRRLLEEKGRGKR